MDRLKVISVNSNGLLFENGISLYSDHIQSCCESHYLSFGDYTLSDFDGLVFDLTNDNFFDRIEDYGIALKPINGFPVRVPGYASNNGYYSCNLSLVISGPDGFEKTYDITECQDY